MAAGPAQFADLDCNLSDATLQVISSLGFERATPVQEAVIPLFCGNKDVAVDACTGSGKTLAFLVPIIEKLRKLEEALKKHQVGAIIVSPTRELARQIFEVAKPFVASLPGMTAQLLVGGSDPGQDVMTFKDTGGHLIVGTPGRIDDIMKRCGAMDLKRLEVLVLDEADRLLDMGFQKQVDAIMARLPKQRRTGLFSATQTEAVQALARAGLRNPVRVNVAVTAAPTPAPKASKGAIKGGQAAADSAAQAAAEPQQQKTPTGLSISYTICEVDQKLPQLVRFLQLHAAREKIIVYCLTCACVDFYALALKRLAQQQLKGVQVHALHGRMKQAARESTLEGFTKQPAGVLLATDLAARGLDIPEVHWVLQMDPPQDPAAFVHRVGRTARAGRAGAALVYLARNEANYVDFLKLRKVPMAAAEPLEEAPDVLPVLRHEAEGDREVMESGMKAFVSYVRGYKEHHCRFIFRVQDLPIGRLATSFALLRLPHMPEVKRALTRVEGGARAAGLPTCEHFSPSEVDPDTVTYKDKKKEKQRQQMLKQRAGQAQAEEARGASAPSKAGGKPQGKAQAPGAAPVDTDPGARLTATKRRKLQARDEYAELDAEYRLLKKLKRGKLSEREFDVATGLSSDDDNLIDQMMSDEQDEEEDGSKGNGTPGRGSGGGGAKGHSGRGKGGHKAPEGKGKGPVNGQAGRGGVGKAKAGSGGRVNAGVSSVQQKLDSKRKKQKRKQHRQPE